MPRYRIIKGQYQESGTTKPVSARNKDVFDSRYDLIDLFGADRFELVDVTTSPETSPAGFESLRPQDPPAPLGKAEHAPKADEPVEAPEEPVEAPVSDLGELVKDNERVALYSRKKWYRVFLDGVQNGPATRSIEEAEQRFTDLIEAL